MDPFTVAVLLIIATPFYVTFKAAEWCCRRWNQWQWRRLERALGLERREEEEVPARGRPMEHYLSHAAQAPLHLELERPGPGIPRRYFTWRARARVPMSPLGLGLRVEERDLHEAGYLLELTEDVNDRLQQALPHPKPETSTEEAAPPFDPYAVHDLELGVSWVDRRLHIEAHDPALAAEILSGPAFAPLARIVRLSFTAADLHITDDEVVLDITSPWLIAPQLRIMLQSCAELARALTLAVELRRDQPPHRPDELP